MEIRLKLEYFRRKKGSGESLVYVGLGKPYELFFGKPLEVADDAAILILERDGDIVRKAPEKPKTKPVAQ